MFLSTWWCKVRNKNKFFFNLQISLISAILSTINAGYINNHKNNNYQDSYNSDYGDEDYGSYVDNSNGIDSGQYSNDYVEYGVNSEQHYSKFQQSYNEGSANENVSPKYFFNFILKENQ